jgi:hypothetical protein
MFPEANRLHVIKQVMMWEERGERRGDRGGGFNIRV